MVETLCTFYETEVYSVQTPISGLSFAHVKSGSHGHTTTFIIPLNFMLASAPIRPSWLDSLGFPNKILCERLSFDILMMYGEDCCLFQPNISSVCRTTRSMKEFLSFSPLAFTRVPPEMTASKLISRYRCWKFSLAFVLKKLWFYVCREFCDFWFRSGLFPRGNFG